MTTVEQQLVAVNVQLLASQEHVGTLSAAIDAVRKEASDAVLELRNAAVAEQQRTAQLSEALARQTTQGRAFDFELHLVNTKDFAGGKFGGGKTESFKVWAEKVRIFCNAQRSGFRKALESVELNEDVPVSQSTLAGMIWEHADTANQKLSDFLHAFTTDDALGIVEGHPEQGFEAWRLLKKRYNPAGGRFELDRMTGLLARKRCKDLTDLPAVIDRLERDLRNYEISTSMNFPPEWKIPLLLQLMPESHAREMTMKYTMGERDFSKMVSNITGFATEARVLENRGRKEIDVDNIQPEQPEQPEHSPQDWTEYCQTLQDRLS